MQQSGGRDWNRLERHALDCIAEANKKHTPEEIAAAELAYLSYTPASPQPSLFSAPPNVGLITGGQPEPTGLADRSAVGL